MISTKKGKVKWGKADGEVPGAAAVLNRNVIVDLTESNI